MIACEVMGTVWSTRKESKLSGIKMLIVRPIDYVKNNFDGQSFIVADMIGAGVGEQVLVTCGSSARAACGDLSIPVDAAVIGIIDDKEVLR